jgi:hypothetical protein
VARKKVKTARLKNKVCFDKTHRLRPVAIKEGDWVLILDNSLDMQYSALKKFAHQFRRPYVVTKIHDNAPYTVWKLDGAEHRILYAGKNVKLFNRRIGPTNNKILEEGLKDVYDNNVEEEMV